MTLPATWLFVPGGRPERFAKAVAAGAGLVILDLEDAVVPERKAEARAQIATFIADGEKGGCLIAVRVNPLETMAGLADLAALLPRAAQPDLFLLSKVENGASVALAGRLLADADSSAGLAALIESARGVAHAEEIATASPRLTGLMFGAADYAADLGQRGAGFDTAFAQAAIVNAAAIAGLAAIDSPDFPLDDAAGLAAAACRARELGFHGKAAIHPRQVPIIETAFTPGATELAEARLLLERSDGRASAVEGRMVDVAMLRWARRVVACGTGL